MTSNNPGQYSEWQAHLVEQLPALSQIDPAQRTVAEYLGLPHI